MYGRLKCIEILTWIPPVGAAAEEQRVGQCPVLGCQDSVRGWYPFDREFLLAFFALNCSKALLAADGTIRIYSFFSWFLSVFCM